MKYTKGPWEVVYHGSRPVEAVYKKRGMRATGDHYPMICQMPDNYSPSIGNANLIAHAPDLYEILAEIIKSLPGNRDWLDPTLEDLARDILKELENNETGRSN